MPSRIIAITLLALGAMSAYADTDPLTLPIGDPARSDRQLTPVLDGITDTQTADVITAAELASRLARIQVLLIGEEHTNIDFHRVEAGVIKALHAAGRDVVVGLEMYPYTASAALDRWSQGKVTEPVFVDSSGWYDTWGYRWEYYRDIFVYARDNRLPMAGINAPREIIKTIRQSGFAAVAEADRKHLPPAIDTDNAEHRRMFMAYVGGDPTSHGHQLSDAEWDGMYNAQCTWDAVMGWNSVRALEQHPGPRTIVVSLLGSGHVTYGLGAQRQIAARLPGAVATLLPVPVADAKKGGAVVHVQASYANFIWGVPPVVEPVYPELGLSLAGPPATENNKVVQLNPGSPAARAGIQLGDLVLRVDERTIGKTGDLRRSLAAYQWGDSAKLEISRNGEKQNVQVVFRRTGNHAD